uniref:Uncharacterized protein n=1 Tax=Avena sativa TaxID=4498 RepID=A0ACD5YUF5_AVESA
MAGNQQPRVLQALDVARTQWYHFTAIAISGMGFFTDAYDLFSISLVVDVIGHRYYSHRHNKAPPGVSAAISVIALCGTVPGQLVFGWLGDKMGRKRIYGYTLILMVVCSLASGFSFSKRTAKSVVTVLCFFRFWLGVSIGGDYPLSATIMSEYANKKTRGAFIATVFAMQGFGNLAAGIVGMIASKAFEKASPDDIDYIWRIVLMLGAIPALLTYYWRMKMPETARYTALVAMNTKKATSDMAQVLDMHITPEEEAAVDDELVGNDDDQYGVFSLEFCRRHGLHLVGTTVCWFVLDVTFYSLNLFMKDIFTIVKVLPGPDEPGNQVKRMIHATGLHTAVALGGTLPGYFFAVAFIDRIGRIKIQLLGFTMMTILTLCLAIPFHQWHEHKNRVWFVIMYGFTFFFANFGPNTTTFILPAEIFPARMRSTCHGISGAVGKVGAIIGVLAFSLTDQSYPQKNKTDRRLKAFLYVLVACNLVGIVFTLLLPETKGKSLEEITGETEESQTVDDKNAAQGIHAVSI